MCGGGFEPDTVDPAVDDARVETFLAFSPPRTESVNGVEYGPGEPIPRAELAVAWGGDMAVDRWVFAGALRECPAPAAGSADETLVDPPAGDMPADNDEITVDEVEDDDITIDDDPEIAIDPIDDGDIDTDAMTIAEIKAAVGTNPALAAEALREELAGRNRSTLVKWLTDLLEV